MSNLRLTILLSILVLSSCYNESSIELKNTENLLVINSIMREGDSPLVQISRTSNDLTSPISLLDSAEVELYKNESIIASLWNKEEGEYINDSVHYEPGNYELSVNLNNQNYSVSQGIPSPHKIYNVKHLNKAGKTDENIIFPSVKLKISNDPTSRSYFQLRVFMFEKNGNQVAVDEVDYIEFNDSLFTREGLDIPIFTNEFIQGDTLDVQLNYSTGRMSGVTDNQFTYDLFPIVVELNTITEDYYKYLRSVYLYEQGRYPNFVNSPPPVFSTYSNVENGLGIVAGLSTTRTDTITP